MNRGPARWTRELLAEAAELSTKEFRDERLSVSDAWDAEYEAARGKFNKLFKTLNLLNQSEIRDADVAEAFEMGLGEALRYLAGPPISDDDLRVITGVESMAPSTLGKNPEAVRKVMEVIERVIDPHRFPWIAKGIAPTPKQREAALVASSVLLAAQRIATERRNSGKNRQEEAVKEYLRKLGFVEVGAKKITTIVNGPKEGEFCSECELGDRKADIVVRLFDTRLMAIECKVSNSATNSVKRLNNDAAVKAGYWLDQFGTLQVVPAAVLAGVFKVLNLEQAQQRNLALIWAHDLEKLGKFIRSTR
ncbi:MAG: XamI family restriction endonuclease [Verrucomicrobiales bacterium]|nr:XamI family restriction endonuclease [Verrucomicrobiales bacterium]